MAIAPDRYWTDTGLIGPVSARCWHIMAFRDISYPLDNITTTNHAISYSSFLLGTHVTFLKAMNLTFDKWLRVYLLNVFLLAMYSATTKIQRINALVDIHLHIYISYISVYAYLYYRYFVIPKCILHNHFHTF